MVIGVDKCRAEKLDGVIRSEYEYSVMAVGIRKPLARCADLLLPEGLEKFLRDAKTEGKTLRVIARELWVATDGEIDTNAETIRLWIRDLGIEEAVA